MTNEAKAATSEPASASVAVRLSIFLAAISSIGIGVGLMVEAHLGAAPNDVMNTGVAETFGWGVGTAATVTSVIWMVVAWSMRRRPRPATVLGGFIVGTSINVALGALPTPDAIGARVAFLSLGLAIVWTGITGVVSADIGAGPLELVMLALMDRRVGIRIARWGLELTLVLIGLALGGTAGLGTAIFAFGTGPVLAITLPQASRRLGTHLVHEV